MLAKNWTNVQDYSDGGLFPKVLPVISQPPMQKSPKNFPNFLNYNLQPALHSLSKTPALSF